MTPRMSEAEKIYFDRRKKQESIKIKAYRDKVRGMGIVKFIESLPCPPFSQNDEGVTPDNIILEPYQKDWFVQVLGIPRSLLTAGRSNGKSFCLALLVLWYLIIEDYCEISVIGGSLKQTQMIQNYIEFWRGEVEEIEYILWKSLHGLQPKVKSRFKSVCTFLATSQTSARGLRAQILIIDEFCSGESKSTKGAQSLKAAVYQLMGRKNAKLILTSTSDYVRGRFYEILTQPKRFGFIVFKWSIARHISGQNPRLTYSDKNPEHWFSNCWWINDEQIRSQRMNASDAEFMVEVLGGISMASGFVFDVDDLNVSECKLCENCEPYTKKCKLVKYFGLGNSLENVVNLKAGFDYGQPAPCALVIVGQKGRLVFVLYSDEMKGLRLGETVSWVGDELTKWKCFDIYPDPSLSTRPITEELDTKGFNTLILEHAEKYSRIENLRSLIEKKRVIIPYKYWRLMKSLRSVTFDKFGKITKSGDHSFDAFCYACADYHETYQPALDLKKGIKLKFEIED